jgi:hypothetical protein
MCGPEDQSVLRVCLEGVCYQLLMVVTAGLRVKTAWPSATAAMLFCHGGLGFRMPHQAMILVGGQDCATLPVWADQAVHRVFTPSMGLCEPQAEDVTYGSCKFVRTSYQLYHSVLAID